MSDLLVNQFIINLMSQHVVPFWVTLGILFFVVVEIFYFYIIRNEPRRESIGDFAVKSKFKSILCSIIIFAFAYGIGVIIELVSAIIIPILLIVGVIGIVLGYFYINYLFAKRYAKSYDFKKGDKLKVVHITDLMPSAVEKTPKDSIVTCLSRLTEKKAYRLKTSKGEIVERKEWRLEKA